MKKVTRTRDTKLSIFARRKRVIELKVVNLALKCIYEIFADKTDDCQSAYQMYRCGKDKAPTVFGKMVVYEEGTSVKVKQHVL